MQCPVRTLREMDNRICFVLCLLIRFNYSQMNECPLFSSKFWDQLLPRTKKIYIYYIMVWFLLAFAECRDFPEKCYPTLGCFNSGPPFYGPPQRPVSLLPFDLDHIDTSFHLFSTSNPKNPVTFAFDAESPPESSFDKQLDTKVLIHGYTVDLKQNSSQHEMKDALLKHGNYNVIIVNWTSSNQPPYAQAVANARVVAAQLAHVINNLEISRELQPSSVHLIGHSLGAHLAGWAGKRIKGLGRITGLDPAGPYFWNADPLARLHSDDAVFVDVIIANGAFNETQGLGIYENIGDINFYPNGGKQQPGCENVSPEGKLSEDYQRQRNSCSHQRTVDLFISSIKNDDCQFWGLSCNDYQDFTSGNCNRRRFLRRNSRPVRVRMGLYAEKPVPSITGQNFYLSTSSSPPFCTEE